MALFRRESFATSWPWREALSGRLRHVTKLERPIKRLRPPFSAAHMTVRPIRRGSGNRRGTVLQIQFKKGHGLQSDASRPGIPISKPAIIPKRHRPELKPAGNPALGGILPHLRGSSPVDHHPGKVRCRQGVLTIRHLRQMRLRHYAAGARKIARSFAGAQSTIPGQTERAQGFWSSGKLTSWRRALE
jgi:hypothetical protein